MKERHGAERFKDSDIAVIGLAGRFPGAPDVLSLWRNLRAGHESIRRFSDAELVDAGIAPGLLGRPDYVKAMGVLDGVELFDAGLFGLSPREAEITDPQFRLFLECALEALENAGHAATQPPGLIGVYAGASLSSYLWGLLRQPALVSALGLTRLLLGNEKDYLATWTSYKLNLRGPSLSVQTACSTSLVAVHLACQALVNGECDIALAGGTSVKAQQRSGYLYREDDILSPDGHCRPFDAQARGTVAGSGVAIVVLRRLADALEDGDAIRAVIKGTAINNDGSLKVGYTAPAVEGQARAIREAIAVAEVDSDSIDYVEAHGTATALGDPVEVAALRQAFGRRTRPCFLGAVKANFGHLDTAAGVTGLIKTILALEHGEVPPTPYFRSPNPQIDFGPFRVASELAPWPRNDHPRRAGVSSFGIGGTNAHVVLEEAPDQEPSGPSRPWQILPLSAKTASALETVAADLGRHLASLSVREPNAFADVAYTLQVGRRVLPHRRVVVCRDAVEAVTALSGREAARAATTASELRHRPVFFLFPGQGAQYAGMTAELYASEPGFRRRVDTSAEILLGILGFDLRSVLYPSPAEREAAELRLRETAITQPALFVVEHALAELWMEWGVRPRGMLGHSLGEYVAACLAGVLTLPDALRLVAARGRLMDEMPPGAMLSVPRPTEEVARFLTGGVALAAVNAPDRCTVSGSVEAIERLASLLAAQGVESRLLRTSHAFHSPLMEPAAERFAREVAAVPRKAPKLRYIANLTGTWVGDAEVAEPTFWARQLREPVLFAAGIDELLREDAAILLEVGPGAALTAFARRQLDRPQGGMALASLPRPEETASEVQGLLGTVGQLWLQGVEIDWRRCHAGERRRRVPLPTYPFERQRYWIAPSSEAEPAPAPAPESAESEREPERLHPRPDDLATTYAEPVSESERYLAALWRELLGIDRVGRHDNFFELGGDSLLATQLFSRLRLERGAGVPLRTIFEAPTLAGLGAVVDRVAAELAPPAAPPIRPQPRDRDLPLSFAQQRLWFLEQLQPGRPVYNLPMALRLRGELAVPALAASLGEVVRRHESLRTTFVEVQGHPFQRIGPPAAVPLGTIDLGGLGTREREGELARLALDHAARPFDLVAGPLLQSALVRLDAGEHAVLLNQHHIISDGWSTGVLVREVVTLYTAFASGRPSPLPDLAVQYADFAVWQREWLAGEMLESQVALWRERLAGLPALLELPTDRPRPAFRTGRGSYCGFHLPAAGLQGLQDLGRREEVTDFMTLLALFQAYLSRLSGQADLAVGTVIANRPRPELEPLIGFFVNTLVMRADLSGSPSLLDLLLRTRESTLQAYAHQDLPFEHLVEALQPVRATSHTPLFQVMLVLQNVPEKALLLPGIEVAGIEGGQRTGKARFDLTLDLKETPFGLLGTFEYSTELFDRTTIVRWSAGFRELLAAAVAAPDARLAELPLLDSAERHQLLLEWNDTSVVRWGAAVLVHELFERQAARQPDAAAVAGQGRTLSYAELESRADRLAHRLRRLGVGAETRVGLCVERSPEMVVALLGILKAGGAYVPLDPGHPAERLALVLGDSEPAVLVTEERWLERLPVGGRRVVCLDRDWERSNRGEEAGRVGVPTEGGPESEILAYVIYTSGSTGRPKGVCLPHRAVANFLLAIAERLELGADVVIPALTTLAFDIATLEIYLPLTLGGRVEVVEGEEAADGHRLAARVAAGGVTALQATPATWRLLLDAGWSGQPGLKALCGGEALPWELASALQARGVELWNVYGPTETAVWSSAGVVAAAPGTGASVGLRRPLAATRFQVVDRALEPVPLGVAGELLIGGAGVARGYWGRPELTAERFVPDPWSAAGGARLYRTGDRVRHRADGELEFLGRLDHQVKLRGFRIELEEVEVALLQHPRVSQAAVVAVGEGTDRRLAACFVSSGAPAPDDQELRDLLRERLPVYMIPAVFIPLQEMPLTPNGKIDRRALTQPASEAPASKSESRAPRTPVEEIVARLWAEVLRLPQVGADDNFFQRGGHSLNGVQVVSRLRQAFQIDLPLRALFEAPTVAGLAAEIERRRRADGLAAAPTIASFRKDRGSPPPLSFGQERFWQGRQREARAVPITIPIMMALKGPLDLAGLRRALSEVVDRHEVLRTSFREDPEGPVQVIHPTLLVELPVVDLGRLAPLDQRNEIQRLSIQDGRRPFDYERGPVFRVTALRRSAQETAVLFTIHHVAFDGWSETLLFRELPALYPAFRAGQPSPLPPLTVQYQDFARWERQTFAGDALARQIAYWREHLHGAVPVDLCAGRPRPARQTFAAGSEGFVVPEALARRLEAFAAEHCATLFMALLAAFKVLLHQETGQDDIVVTCLFANRDQAEIEDLIGYFSARLPLRTSMAPTFRELLERVRAVTLSAHEHPCILYEPVLEGASFLEPGDRGGATSFRVMFQLAKLPPPAGQASSELQINRLPVDTGKIGQDLTLFLFQSDRLSGDLRYNRDVLDSERAIRLRDRFLWILAAAVDAPDRPLPELLVEVSGTAPGQALSERP